MYCPLCRAEYREGIARCARCKCVLVDTLAGIPGPVLLWSGANAELEGQVLPLLEGAPEIPHRVDAGARSGRVFVLPEAFARAQAMVAAAAVRGGAEPQPGGAGQSPLTCALCHAEYRRQLDACATCGGPLLPHDSERPARLVWRVDHRETSRAVLAALRDAGIACHHRAIREHWIHALLMQRPEYEVWILQSDAARAHQVLVHMEKPPHFQEEAPEIAEQAVEQCPFCHAENPQGYAACFTCGIDLAAWQQQPFVPGEGEAPVLLWKGSDPIALSRIVDHLQSESIPFSFLPTSDHLVFELAMARPRWRIHVYSSDAERAFNLIRDIEEPFPFLSAVQEDELAEAPAESAPEIPAERAAVFHPAAANAEAWAGKDPGVAQTLRVAWQENAIESWTVEDADGTQHLWVAASHVALARQIALQTAGEGPAAG